MLAREQRRRLEREDVVMMGLPPRFWDAKFGGITAQLGGDEGPLADRLAAYFRNMDEHRRRGVGVMLMGANGVGKSMSAAVIGMEYRRRGETVLFCSAADVLDYKINETWYSDDTTYWEWIREVDVLILDDLGKGEAKGSGYTQIMWDQLLRHRHDHRRVTIITTNVMDMEDFDGVLKTSTLEVLKEAVLPLRVHGENRRDAAVVDIRSKIMA
jgi:DNA replication protein DnaC